MPKPLPDSVSLTSNLGFYWNKEVGDLAEIELPVFEPGEAERHTIYSLLTLSLLDGYFNGNKSGNTGEYPFRARQRLDNGTYAGGQYLGHNIAGIAVDENGEIIDFDFNHNELFNSSAEHAESRLVRRVFSLNQIYDKWELYGPANPRDLDYGNVFKGLTIYTSLESCAQCSGVMTLANAARVVYLQTDPGQYRVGNMLYNLTRPISQASLASVLGSKRPKVPNKYGAPHPIDAEWFGFDLKARLDQGYADFVAAMAADSTLFWYRAPGSSKSGRSTSMTNFLCTDTAREIFAEAAQRLAAFTLVEPAFQPARSDGEREGVKTNAQVLDHARGFLEHAVNSARRGTPHR